MTTPEQLLEGLVAVERAATGPPAPTGERIWSAIEARLANGPAPPELDSGPLLDHAAVEVAAKVGGSSSVMLKVVGGVVLTGLVGGGLALLLGERDPTPPQEEEEITALEHQAAAPTEPEPAELPPAEPELPPAEPQPELEPIPTPEPPDTTPKPAAPPKKSPVQPKSLTDEVALMQALSTALKHGDSREVLKLVAEHERDFGQGQFIEERRAAKARALCQSGKLAAGKKEAASFASRWPKSIHLASVEQDCGDE
ncbi:MAG: hypothetical protein R6X02_09180 [Enhygromyxa sp.]